jgi:hypothetical protein
MCVCVDIIGISGGEEGLSACLCVLVKDWCEMMMMYMDIFVRCRLKMSRMRKREGGREISDKREQAGKQQAASQQAAVQHTLVAFVIRSTSSCTYAIR